VEGPTHTSVLTKCMDENPKRNDEEVDSLGSPMSKPTLGSIKQATCTKRQDIKEDGRNVQVKKKKNIQIKQSLPSHLLHCTNFADHINEGMTPE